MGKNPKIPQIIQRKGTSSSGVSMVAPELKIVKNLSNMNKYAAKLTEVPKMQKKVFRTVFPWPSREIPIFLKCNDCQMYTNKLISVAPR